MNRISIMFFVIFLFLFSCHEFNNPLDPDNIPVSTTTPAPIVTATPTIIPIIPAPENPAPADSAAVENPTPLLDWEDTVGAVNYHLQLNTESDFTGSMLVDASSLTASQYQVTLGLLNFGSFFWKVRVKNRAEIWGDWSDTWQFTFIPPAGYEITATVDSVSFDLRFVHPGSYFVGNNPPASDNVTITGYFWMAETEVTYQLWFSVATWALGNGYVFANDGCEGNDGIEGDTPTTEMYQPVTFVNWRDCMIWCNALSERMGYTPIYYTDQDFALPIKTVTNIEGPDLVAGHEDNPYVNWNADGFRLPTEVEWDIAARGASIAVAGGTYGTTYAGSDVINEVAWCVPNAPGTCAVGTKAANELGLHDMSGNVWEWCWGWWGATYPSIETDPKGAATGTNRTMNGGSWDHGDFRCTVGDRDGYLPHNGTQFIGFRPVRAE